MSRVPADTVLFRVLATAALGATLALSACGDDDPKTASTPPAATTQVTGTTEVPVTTTGPDAAATTPPKEPTREEAKAAIAATEKVAKEAGAKASPKEQSDDSLAQQMKRANDALKAAELQVGKPVVSGDDSAALTVDNNKITIVFFKSPRQAASAGAAAEKTFSESAQHVKVARKANRLFLLATPAKPTAKEIATYRQVRKIVNGVA